MYYIWFAVLFSPNLTIDQCHDTKTSALNKIFGNTNWPCEIELERLSADKGHSTKNVYK